MPTISSLFALLGEQLQPVPLWLFFLAPVLLAVTAFIAFYIIISAFAPTPRPSTASEKTCRTAHAEGTEVTLETKQLPCWYDTWRKTGELEPTDDILLSVVIPAYNEEQRLPKMLEEAVDYLYQNKPYSGRQLSQPANSPWVSKLSRYEILIVSDGSTDGTVQVALDYAKEHPHIPIKVIQLEKNRGKGGAVTHGLRHAQGERVLFVDADGATTFGDISKLEKVMDKLVVKGNGKGVIIGSRAHMVGSEAVVKVRFTSLYSRQKLTHLAIISSKSTNVRFSSLHPSPHHSPNFPHRRHTVWIQTTHAHRPARHCAIHALRGLDFRRGATHAG
jgi:dolichyl-phosphate beta-glucosyltransferase